MKFKSAGHVVIPLAAAFCLTPWLSSAGALVLGLAIALAIGNPYVDLGKKWIHRLLSLSVMGLGAGMNLGVIGRVGFQGIGYTVVGICTTVVLGTLLGRRFRNDRDTSLLITMGTAICGGSAIAAIAPVINAKNQSVSVSLGTVFALNATALILFPWIGRHLGLSQTQFGLWSALAIHDTSSVVGATLQYGAQALQVGTTVKLARALWIIPAAIAVGLIRAKEHSNERNKQGTTEIAAVGKVKKPWFILGFILVAALVTWFPELQPYGHQVEAVAKKLMIVTLFLIGAGLSTSTLKSVGWRPFALGISLWLIIASLSLAAIYAEWIHA